MATKATTKKVPLHTERQYEEALTSLHKVTEELTTVKLQLMERDEQLKRAFDVAEKFKKQGDESMELREKENGCDNTATLRIIELVRMREPAVRSVLLSNAISVIKFRAEESVRRLETKHNELIDQLERARAASNDIFELVK